MAEIGGRSDALVDQYVAEGKTAEAVALLFDMIVESARKKDFVAAEALRNRLFEVDSFALTQIIKSGEIIEEEKRGAISNNHLATWAALYNNLGQTETNALYHAMKEVKIESDQRVFRQGDRMPRLFFINSGHAKLTFLKGDREMLLRKVGPCDVVGSEMFFSNTLCTCSMTALSALHLHYLDQDVLKVWATSHPGLEDKLRDYCFKRKNAEEAESAANRRTHTRVKMPGSVMFQILDDKGVPSGPVFKGSLADLSLSGLSFYVKITIKDNARMLLGRSLGIQFTPEAGASGEPVSQSGTVVAVHSLPFEEHSVHIRFLRHLPPAIAAAYKLNG